MRAALKYKYAFLYLGLFIFYVLFVEIRNKFVLQIVQYSFPCFILTASIFILTKRKKYKDPLPVIVLGGVGFSFGLIILLLTNFWAGQLYEDSKVYKSTQHENVKIIFQYFDEGALGGHSRSIKCFEIVPSLRLYYEFKSIRINGTWKVYEYGEYIRTETFNNFKLESSR